MDADDKSSSDSPDTESDDRTSMARTVDLAYQLIAICVMSALPALGGFYLDRWLGSGLVFTVVGLVFGLATSIFQFMKMLKRLDQKNATNLGKTNDRDKGR